jgi:crotonobetainyl-CoA:carnitine CoA-transferase CaiB-like acyl-CoA transferase
MPARLSAWGVYDVFSVKDGEQIFLAVVSDTAWRIFCEAFGFHDLLADTRIATNNDRVRSREWLMPILRERLASHRASELAAIFERHALPFAPITRPQDLLDDPHLKATGGLAPITLPDGRQAHTVLLPLTLDGERPGGYMSVRTMPTREQVDAAENLYAKMRAEKQAGRMVHTLNAGSLVVNTLGQLKAATLTTLVTGLSSPAFTTHTANTTIAGATIGVVLRRVS